MIELDYQPLSFGLDEASGLTNPQIGRLIGCENFELIFGDEGMRRINGYEAFDGRAEPHLAVVSAVEFSDGVASISAGDTITTGTGSALVLRVALSSGTWGTDAAGTLAVTAITGTIEDAQTINVSASPKATVVSYSAASIDGPTYQEDVAAARDHYRGLITRPTGEGAILGLKIWDDTIICMRNAVGGLTATLWRSSASGWVAIRTGLRPSGAMRAIVANFSGDSAERAMYIVDGKNRYMRLTSAWSVTFGPVVYPTEGTSSTSITPGLGSKAFTTEGSRDWTVGDSLIAYSQADATKFVSGLVTASTASSVTIDATTFGGTVATDWHICRTDGVDRPYRVAEHRSYLMLAYPRGQLQTTDVGDPMTIGASSDAFGLGGEITDMRGLRGDVLGVFTVNGVSLLYGDGSTAAPWDLKRHTASGGALNGGAQEIGGDAVYTSSGGIHTLAGTQAFGDFSYSNVSRNAQATLRSILPGFACTSLSKRDGQYRIYGEDAQVLVMTVYGQPSTQTVRFTRLRYLHQPTCADSELIDGADELMVFGTDDGWVMRERIGTTFNGEPITSFLRTSYWHARKPQLRKRFRKLTIDVDASLTQVALLFRQDIDFYGVDQAEPYNYTVNVGGGYYDNSFFDQFFWDGEAASQVHASIDGIGRHMSVILNHEGDVEPFIVRGMHLQYSPLGLQR